MAALKAVDLEFGNVRAAWDWATATTAIDLLRRSMEALVMYYWLRSSWFREGASAFERAVAAVRS